MNILVLLCASINYTGQILFWLIFIRTIMSWLDVRQNNPAVRLVFYITDFILTPIRRLLSRTPLGGSGMMMDFSPIAACLLIQFITWLIINILLSFTYTA